MKIGLVLDDTLDTPDGVQQYVRAVGGWLQGQGHEVRYLVGQTERTDLPGLFSLSRNLQVKFNGNTMSMPLPASRRRLKQLLREEQFDVLHVQVPYSPFLAGRLIKLANKRVAIVGTFHVLPYSRVERWANHGLALLNYRTGRRFAAMIAASSPAAEFARQCYGFRATVIGHPFDYKRFQVSPDETAGPVTIVYLARLVPRKGAAWLLKALAELKRRGKLTADIRVTIGGKGPLRQTLEAYVRQHGLGDNVTFIGFVPEEEKAAVLAHADIAVFPSTSGESFGISIIEALAAVRGVVLAGDNPGYRAAMPADARLHDPTDTVAYADLLEYWLAHPAERLQAAQNQRAHARQFDIDIICRQVETVYKQALQSIHTS